MSKYEQFTNEDVYDGEENSSHGELENSKTADVQGGTVNDINFDIAPEIASTEASTPTEFRLPESLKNGSHGKPANITKTPTFDQIEIEIHGANNSDNNNDEALVNAKDFFLEFNENYQLSWEEASQRVSDGGDKNPLGSDPAKPPVPGWNQEYVMWKTRRVIESIWFRIFTLTLILVDVTIVIIEIAKTEELRKEHEVEHNKTFLIIDLFITIYFVIEIGLRIWVLGKSVFFSEWFNVVDFAVVLITLITAVAVVAAAADAGWAKKLAVLVVLRLVRGVRLIRVCTEKKQVEISARQLISQNKRRYQQDGYDLDLTYVTKSVIATSFPSTGECGCSTVYTYAFT